MRLVAQTILANNQDGIPGNCVQAALASYLDLPLDAVPHFLLWDDWSRRMKEWLAERGFEIAHISARYYPLELTIVAGTSPRQIGHAVLAEDGQIVWDPHPSNSGLTSIRERWDIWKRA